MTGVFNVLHKVFWLMKECNSLQCVTETGRPMIMKYYFIIVFSVVVMTLGRDVCLQLTAALVAFQALHLSLCQMHFKSSKFS